MLGSFIQVPWNASFQNNFLNPVLHSSDQWAAAMRCQQHIKKKRYPLGERLTSLWTCYKLLFPELVIAPLDENSPCIILSPCYSSSYANDSVTVTWLGLVIHILRSYVSVSHRFWPNKLDCVGTISTAVCIVLFLMVKGLRECLRKHIRQLLWINSFSVFKLMRCCHIVDI